MLMDIIPWFHMVYINMHALQQDTHHWMQATLRNLLWHLWILT